ncbi:hypothetical protein Tco_1275005 [Tanacetum coccineum]
MALQNIVLELAGVGRRQQARGVGSLMENIQENKAMVSSLSNVVMTGSLTGETERVRYKGWASAEPPSSFIGQQQLSSIAAFITTAGIIASSSNGNLGVVIDSAEWCAPEIFIEEINGS